MPVDRQVSHKCTNCYTKASSRWFQQSSYYGGKCVCENCHSYARKGDGRKRPPHLQGKLDKDRFEGAAYAPDYPGSCQRCSNCNDGPSESSGVIWPHSMREPRKWLCGRCGAVELQKNNASSQRSCPEQTSKSPTSESTNNKDKHTESESDCADSDFTLNSSRKRKLRKRRGRSDVSTASQDDFTQPQPPYSQPRSPQARTEKLDNESHPRRESGSAKPFSARQRDIPPATMPTTEQIQADNGVEHSTEVRKKYAMLLSLVVEVEMVSKVGGTAETQARIEAALDLVREMLAHHGVQPAVRLMELLLESKINLQAGKMERMAASVKDCRDVIESHLA